MENIIDKNSIANGQFLNGTLTFGSINSDSTSSIISASEGSIAYGVINSSGSIEALIGGAHAGGYVEGGMQTDEIPQIIANGKGAHAEGYAFENSDNHYIYSINASGNGAHAEGIGTKALSDGAHAEGYITIANGAVSHAEGYNTSTYGKYSHTEGWDTSTNGVASHAEGHKTYAFSDYSHAEGENTIAEGKGSHAEGYGTIANLSYSHAEGQDTSANGVASHTEGQNTKANGPASHAEGYNTIANSSYSHAEGLNAHAEGDIAHAEGFNTHALGINAHAEGFNTIAKGNNSHAEGQNTSTNGVASHAEGLDTSANGIASHAEGCGTVADSSYAHAEGLDTSANGIASHAEGYGTIADSSYSHAEGKGEKNAISQGKYYTRPGGIDDKYYNQIRSNRGVDDTNNIHIGDTLKIGNQFKICTDISQQSTNYTLIVLNEKLNPAIAQENAINIEIIYSGAYGEASHISGTNTIAINDNQTVIGQYNKPVKNALFVIGNGTQDTSRSNALTVYDNGIIKHQIRDVSITQSNDIYLIGQSNDLEEFSPIYIIKESTPGIYIAFNADYFLPKYAYTEIIIGNTSGNDIYLVALDSGKESYKIVNGQYIKVLLLDYGKTIHITETSYVNVVICLPFNGMLDNNHLNHHYNFDQN